MSAYYQVKISAESKEQAETILDSLLEKKLVTGGQFLSAPARFLWKGKVVDMDYLTLTSYTTEEHKDAVIEDVRRTTAEEVPMITFILITDLNIELSKWIDETLA